VETNQQVNHGYVFWFYNISLPFLLPHVEGDPLRLTNREVLIEHDNVNATLNALQICKRVRKITLDVENDGQEYVEHAPYDSL